MVDLGSIVGDTPQMGLINPLSVAFPLRMNSITAAVAISGIRLAIRIGSKSICRTPRR